jgi:hypothetical protein
MKKWEQGDAEQPKKIIRVLLAGEYLYRGATSSLEDSYET